MRERHEGQTAHHVAGRRVRELADEITEAQRREIAEMEWLIADIEANGVARTEEEAAERPVPEFDPQP